ncbi:MAG: glycerol kinase [Ardenticatenia bacterium]|nr:MAG: glycerol kinase [Ardenticatenia bacterium]
MNAFIVAIDQGTTSTRCALFDQNGHLRTIVQREHRQFYPQPGWVEHDPLEIWQATQEVIREARAIANVAPQALTAVGITNQRETIVVWNRHTGKPYYPAIVWQDTRTREICQRLAEEGVQDHLRAITGLPLTTYFSAPKLYWLLEHVPGLRSDAERGDALFGTVDSWLVWWLSGGPYGGIHITDVTNASRTLLMNLHTLDWDEELLRLFGIPRQMLPRIVPSADPKTNAYTERRGPFDATLPVCGILGDQQAALVGQACFSVGEVKNTYGTGYFMLLNTGHAVLPSSSGLLTTVAYRLGDQPVVYALEGSVAIAGALVQWLRDNLGIISTSAEVETLARTVEDNGDVYFVPAFSGLFAPYWRADARGLIIGLTRHTHKGHLARAALEATAFQTRAVLEAMQRDTGIAIQLLKVDGGMVSNALLMQFQADILGVPVVRPRVSETTALGAAYAAGLAAGLWSSTDALRAQWISDQCWQPHMDATRRERLYRRWLQAVERAIGWLE